MIPETLVGLGPGAAIVALAGLALAWVLQPSPRHSPGSKELSFWLCLPLRQTREHRSWTWAWPALALRVAISEHLCFQSGGQIGLLVLDEVFGPLDADRKDRMLRALERLRGPSARFWSSPTKTTSRTNSRVPSRW